MTISREQTQSKLDLHASGVLAYTPEEKCSMADHFETIATDHGDNIFIIWRQQKISYRVANQHSNHIAHHLTERHHIKVGDTVALMAGNSPDFIYTWLALAKLGAVVALLNTQARYKALEHAIKTTYSQLLIIDPEHIKQLDTITASAMPSLCQIGTQAITLTHSDIDISCIDTQQQRIDNPPATIRQAIKGEDTLCLVFTSGTTGLPKAAYITQMRWLGTGEGWKRVLSLDENTVFYCVLPLFHGAAGMSLLSTVLASHGSMVLKKSFSAREFWQDINTHKIHFAQYSGEMCRYLLNQEKHDNEHTHSLRYMTGAGLSANIYKIFKQRFNIEHLIEGYGGTELNIGMCNLDGVAGSCGRIPFKEKSNARLVRYDFEKQSYIRDTLGWMQECQANEPGELIGQIINMPGLAIGRFNGYTDVAASSQKILHNVFQEGDSWLSSGDILSRDDEDYYYFIDRLGDTFRWKSENVSTTAVADALSSDESIFSINVYGVKIPEQEGRCGMVALVMADNKQFNPERFYQLAQLHLATYAMPVFVRIIKDPNITATLKLQKFQLQQRGYAKDNNSDTLYVLDSKQQQYLPINAETLKQLNIKPFQKATIK